MDTGGLTRQRGIDEKERVKLALLHFKARRGWSRSWENLTEAARGPIEANVITIQTCARRFLGTFPPPPLHLLQSAWVMGADRLVDRLVRRVQPGDSERGSMSPTSCC
jgi:hypothetical protein